MAYIETLLTSIATVLKNLGGIISVILFILAGIVYGLSYMQPSESKGKWQTIAVGMFIGAIIVGAIVAASDMLTGVSQNLLTS